MKKRTISNVTLTAAFGALLAVSPVVITACGDDAGPSDGLTQNDGSDASTDQQPASIEPDASDDLGSAPDLEPTAACHEERLRALSAHNKVSTGAVSNEAEGALNTMKIDATAGGFRASHQNPWIYVSFKTKGRVDISDVDALNPDLPQAKSWDMAFKRSVVRVNGGDSGPGNGGLVIYNNTSLKDVSDAPSSGFKADEFIDESCEITRDPINNIRTAFGGPEGIWYIYATGSKLRPKPDTFVVRLADGKTLIKLAVDSFYKGNAGGHYTIRWTAL